MDDTQERAFGFSGTWRDYAPIAFTNLLLTIVTLGIYRFWATTRTRHYLWSQTRFIDARLEWTGTGKELFVGFLMVLLLLLLPLILLQFAVPALILRGYGLLGGVLGIVLFAAFFYLGGLARYRALRYRLSRTWWHGIRGGSDDNGWSYGWSYMWKSFVGSLALGLLIPWSIMSLWDERWNRLSFGPFSFEAAGDHSKTFQRFLFFYLIPLIALILGIVAFFSGAGGSVSGGILVALVPVGFYAAFGVVALAYYSSFFREAVGGMSLSTLNFQFEARSKDWLLLILGDIGLVIVTLGIGSIFLSYRHWKFFIAHLNATGEIDLNELTQSTAREPRQGEGLLDAFDIGAI